MTKTALLTVKPAAIASLVLGTSSVTGGTLTTLTANLTSPAPTGGTVVVLSVTFGATNTVNVYVNPTSLGGSAPSPTLTQTSTQSLAFNSLVYYGGNTSGESSIDEVRLGTTYAAVTP